MGRNMVIDLFKKKKKSLQNVWRFPLLTEEKAEAQMVQRD